MYKIIIAAVLLGTVANAGLYSMVAGMSMKEVKPKASYTIDTAGVNPRVYEFTTRVKPIKHCIVLIASSDKMVAPAMQCYPISKWYALY